MRRDSVLGILADWVKPISDSKHPIEALTA
jgi:hypothetical protein